MTLRDLAAGLGDGAQERTVARDVEAELDAHLELAAEALQAEGHAPEEARAIARQRFGDLERVRRECLRIRLGANHAMKIALLVSNLVLVAALLISLMIARAQHVRAQEAMEQALRAQAAALDAAQRAGAAAPAPVDHVLVEVGDVIETFDQHRNVDFSERALVQPDGQVLLHDVGWISVAGLTREALERRLTEAYEPYYQDLTVNALVHKAGSLAAGPAPASVVVEAVLGGATTVIEVGDSIEVFDRDRELDFGGRAKVAPDGQVLLPHVGWVQAAGLERDELAKRLSAQLYTMAVSKLMEDRERGLTNEQMMQRRDRIRIDVDVILYTSAREVRLVPSEDSGSF